MKITCSNCFYITSKESKEFPLSDYHTMWGCSLHNLYDREVHDPHSQRCDDFLSKKSGEKC